jgi:hypothetical protein
MTIPFQWKNCYADVASSGYGQIARAFLKEVVEPSLSALQAQLESWSRSDDPGAPFAQSDTEVLLHATTLAFCLAIQSMWERQVRTYLRGCAEELRPGSALAKRVMTERWEGIDRLFYDLRGISLTKFEAYGDLDLLQLLGNACRHGDGPSARKLWDQHPDLWPQRKPSPSLFDDDTPAMPGPQSIDAIVLSQDLIRRFADAIASFWDDAEYIYLESIEQKHASVEAKLVTMRLARATRDVAMASNLSSNIRT